MSFHPRPYQQVAVDSTLRQYAAGRRSLLLHLPTGAGKTVIAALLLERLRREKPRLRTLFVAHRKEIIDQTAGTLRRHLPALRVNVEQGSRRAAANDADVVVASVQSLVRRKERYSPSDWGLIIADECHRALAPTWTEVLEYFRCGLQQDGLLVGMTATPRRTDGRSATATFSEVAYEISRTELQDLGFLSPMRYFNVQADLRLDRVKVSGGDFQVGSLSGVMNTPAVRKLTLGAWAARGKGRKTLAFCAGLEHAEQLAADFAGVLGLRTGMVHGRSTDRDELLQRFRDGDIDLMTNYGVLTEGFDEPTVECVLMARPTQSPLVYTQCVGRGLRPSAGKVDCTVIDIVDRGTHQLQYGAAHMAGLPAGWRSQGRDPFREKHSLGGISVTDPEAFLRIRSAGSLEEVQQILMELPPETVLAGLDGEPVLRYRPAEHRPTADEADAAVRSLLRQATAATRGLSITDDDVQVRLVHAEDANERFAYLRWHMERASGRRVTFEEPPARRFRRPRAALRAMLRPGLALTELTVDEGAATARATVAGLMPWEGDWLRQAFQAETGLALDLGGQLGFAF